MVAAISVEELLAAWPRVRSGGASAGCDGVTPQDADRNPEELARSIAARLASGTWAPAPLRRVLVDKPSGGVREIAIPTVADRLLAAALLARLEPRIRPRLHPAAHAYIAGRGSHSAIAQIEAWRRDGDRAAYTADIRDFFPSIDVGRLFALLASWLPDQWELLALARTLLEAPYDDGTPPRGLPQGSALSPLCSNAYLAAFDGAQSERGHYLRYSDNLLLCDRDLEALEARAAALERDLAALSLHIKPQGAVCAPLASGIPFLGFTLTDQGVLPGSASLDHLQATIAEADADAAARGAVLPRAEIDQHLQRWASYFRRPPPPPPAVPHSDDPQLVAAAEQLLNEAQLLWQSGNIDRIAALAPRAKELHALRDQRFHRSWGAYCLAAGAHAEAEAALRRHLQLVPNDPCGHWLLGVLHLRNRCIHEALAAADACVDSDPGFAEGFRLLATCYRLLGAETLAAQADRDAAAVPRDTSAGVLDLIRIVAHRPRTVSTSAERDAVLRLLAGHDGMHAVGGADSTGRATYRHVAGRIDHDLLREHLAGRIVLAAYPVRADGTVRYAVMDIDIASKTLQRHRYDDEKIAEFKQRATVALRALLDAAHALGLQPVPEETGGRGYHLWFLFADPVPAERARCVLFAVRDRAGALPPGINLEVFPANDRPDPEIPGNRIRLPCGVHPITRCASRILDRHLQPVAHPLQALIGARRIAAPDIERAISGGVPPAPAAATGGDPVAAMLEGCAVLRAIADKAQHIGHLAHPERWVLASCLKPFGEAGRAAVHRIIGHCHNYNQHLTERHLRRIKEQPVGCRRIQELLPNIATTEVCRCRFVLRGNRYPCPTCHAGYNPRRPDGTQAQQSHDAPAAAPPPPRPADAAAMPAAERILRARRLAQGICTAAAADGKSGDSVASERPASDAIAPASAPASAPPAHPAPGRPTPVTLPDPSTAIADSAANAAAPSKSGPVSSSAGPAAGPASVSTPGGDPQAPPLIAPSAIASHASAPSDCDATLVDALLEAQARLIAQRGLLVERLRAAGGFLRTPRGTLRLIDGIPCLEL